MPDKNYHHGDLKSQLIREGLKLLDKEGYEGFTLRKVARACGVSQTAPYRHFKNKDELIAAITMQAMEDFDRRLRQAFARHPDDPAAGLREMGLAYIEFFIEKPEYLRLLFLSDIQNKMKDAGFECEPGGPGLHLSGNHPFAALINAAALYKQTRPDLIMGQDELVLSCWGLVHGISTLIAAGQLPKNADTLELAENVMRGWIV
jgi:AcrR family transcriptional regulator